MAQANHGVLRSCGNRSTMPCLGCLICDMSTTPATAPPFRVDPRTERWPVWRCRAHLGTNLSELILSVQETFLKVGLWSLVKKVNNQVPEL